MSGSHRRVDPLWEESTHYESACQRQACPLKAAHNRLQEAHRTWHHALAEYNDPDAFRTQVNASLQALRNVTFALQSARNEIHGFDSWYGDWQQRFRADSDMVWLKNARNQVVKQSDLDTHSSARVRLFVGWSGRIAFDVAVAPHWTTKGIAKAFANCPLSDQERKHAVLSVERRWVASEQPERELLELLAHGYRELTSLLLSAEAHLDGESGATRESPAAASAGCMVASERERTVWLSLVDGTVTQPEGMPIRSDEDLQRLAEARYGLPEAAAAAAGDSPLHTDALRFFAFARRIFERDGNHVPMVFLVSAAGRVQPLILELDGRPDLYIAMRVVASYVEQVRATSVILINEAWMTVLPPNVSGSILTSSTPAEREEGLSLLAASCTGDRRALLARIKRNSGRAELGQTEAIDFRELAILDPVVAAWQRCGLAVPPGGRRVLSERRPDA